MASVRKVKGVKARRKKRKTPYQLQKARTWRAFSQMIRLRDCLLTTGFTDAGICCTCNKQYPYNDLQAGHFLPGRTNGILFDERGVNAQCRGCNVFGNGQPAKYHTYMLDAYGPEVIEELRRLKTSYKKFTIVELGAMEADYLSRAEYMLQYEQVPD